MPVPVSIRPDRRDQVYVKGRGWIPEEDSREARREREKRRLQEREAEAAVQEMREKRRRRRVRNGIGLLFGGDGSGDQ